MPRAGIEPATRGFSVHCSTSELPRRRIHTTAPRWECQGDQRSGQIGGGDEDRFELLAKSHYNGGVPKWRNGRRGGLKNRWGESSVWVRLPPSAPPFCLRRTCMSVRIILASADTVLMDSSISNTIDTLHRCPTGRHGPQGRLHCDRVVKICPPLMGAGKHITGPEGQVVEGVPLLPYGTANLTQGMPDNSDQVGWQGGCHGSHTV